MPDFTPQAPQLNQSEQSATRIAIAYALMPESRLKLSSAEKQALDTALTKLSAAVWLDG